MTSKLPSEGNPSGKSTELSCLQRIVCNGRFAAFEDYLNVCRRFLTLLEESSPTRIVSPAQQNYIFYQYGRSYDHRITRPLNTDLFYESSTSFAESYGRFLQFLDDLKASQERACEKAGAQKYLRSNEISRVVYTMQQSVGSIGDSFKSPNQCRKRVGQIFENLVKLIVRATGLDCEPRTVKIPVPDQDDCSMSYELDLVISRDKAIIASETHFIHPSEVVGSVKTTSKDRIDKIFLDKYLLTKLLGRDIPVVAVFLHDVQRASKRQNRFGIASTFKKGHFLGYTAAFARLDGVYYVDPRPDMLTNRKLAEQIKGFQDFLTRDLWILLKRSPRTAP